MKSKIIILTLLWVNLSISMHAQTHPYTLKTSTEIEEALQSKQIRKSRAALLYSLIGKYQRSNELSEVPLSWDIDKIDVNGYEIKEAIPEILKAATRSNIVIISENHLKPQHRIFAKQLISELSKIGFNALGMETLSSIDNSIEPLDKKLKERGYALDNPMTGTYTLEPRMASLLKQALILEYDLFSYERTMKIDGVDRDIIQADNIIKYINANPNKKIVILCGFHHVIESTREKKENVNWMAHYLKVKTGIDPLTIYQDHFTEKFKLSEHSFLKNHSIEKPSVFVNDKGNIARLTEEVDIEVIHPKTNYKNNRPDWLKENENYQYVQVLFDSENDTITPPIIAKAIVFDAPDSVPLDIIEILNVDKTSYFVLPKGQYKIKIRGVKNDFEYYQVVK